MKWLEIENTASLKGCITVPGSKNSSLALLAAACMADAPVILNNIPYIRDIQVVCSILREIGAKVSINKNAIAIDPTGIYKAEIDYEKSYLFRTAYYFIGALLAKHRKVSVGYPGGDRIGPRPIDQHVKGLKALGARFTFYDTYYTVEADTLKGTDIYFDTITCGATINVMMAAVRAKGRTVLHNAARDPEVVDVAIFLNKMGAKIVGAGTDIIKIDGVDTLGGCEHTVIADRLIAGTFLIAAGITRGEITVNGIPPEHLDACIEKLVEVGVDVYKSDNSVTAYRKSKSLKATRIKTGMFPAFASDFQQPFTALLLKADGQSIISDPIFPERFNHCVELGKMGADIMLREGSAYITGNASLTGTHVHATDIRAGACLILAGLMAEGTTYLTGVEQLERGYEDVAGLFSSVGARIKLHEGDFIETPVHEKFLSVKKAFSF